MASVVNQPGISGQRSFSGSVQYIGGYDGPYKEDRNEGTSDGNPIPMGLEVFEGVSKLAAHQVIGNDEAWWGRMEFVVGDGAGNQLFDIREIKTLNGLLQFILGQSRPFYMKVINSMTGNWIMELEHPVSCMSPGLCPWASSEMTVRMPTGEVLGHIKHANRETCGSWLGPSVYFDIYNYEGNLIYTVEGPSGYPCECTRDDVAAFKIMKEGTQSEPSYQVGTVTHTWRGPCGGMCSCCVSADPDFVSVSFKQDLSVEDKGLFLGLMFVIMHSYWEMM